MTRTRRRRTVLSRNQFITLALSTILSILALVVSILSWNEARLARLATVTDHVQLKLYASPSSGISFLGQPTETNYIVVQFTGTVANVGASVASLTGVSIEELLVNGTSHYRELNLGIFDSSTNEKLQFPIILESGKSIRINVFVGLKPGPKALKLILANQPMSMNECMEMLAKNGLDIYDNAVKANWSPDGSTLRMFERLPPIQEQRFHLEMDTARGGKLSTKFGWYE